MLKIKEFMIKKFGKLINNTRKKIKYKNIIYQTKCI